MTFDHPQVLYKYRVLEPLSRIRQIFNGELYFSSPKDFNDPIDSIIPFDFNLTPEERKTFFKRNMDRIPGSNRAEKRRNIATAPMKFKNLNAQDLAKQAVYKNYAVYSLSANVLDWRMWSYYADGGRGIAIGFSTNMFSAVPLFKVNYEDMVPKIKVSDTYLARMVSSALTKSTDYSHEQEYRIVCLEEPGVKIFPKNRISKIILGCRVCKEHIEEIGEIVRKLDTKPEIFKMTLPKPGMPFQLILKKSELF